MKIERYRSDILCVTGSNADIPYILLIDLVDSHIETNVVCGSIAYVLHNDVICIAADFIVTLLVTIQAEKNQVGFWKINGECSVRYNINDEKSHLLSFDYQITEITLSVFLEEGFTAAKKENTNTHIIKLLHFISDLIVWMDNRCDIVD